MTAQQDPPSAPSAPIPEQSYVAVVLAGAATLFVELALIRWVPGQIRVLGYFTNFVLLAAFLGLGVGMLSVQRWPRARSVAWAAPFALLAVIGLGEFGSALHVLPSAEEFLFLEYKEHGTKVSLYPFLASSFVLLAASFVPLGYAVGCTLQGSKPLVRYALNIAGSLLGIGVFAALSATGAPPWTWMVLAGLGSCVAIGAAPIAWRAAALAAVAVTTLFVAHGSAGTLWSPYQKITTGPIHLHPQRGVVQEWRLPLLAPEERARVTRLPESGGFTVRVNDDSYQTPVALGREAVRVHPELAGLARQYDLPFLAKKPHSVLVLGAGSGNDVAAALRAGAQRVDAVDIDPEIIRLGQRHPERPYADPRVHVHVADARSFLARSQHRWDAIVFGLIDSHVLTSGKANVRLDSFVFTRESFALARQRLAPEGALVVSHAVGTEWFYERMRATLAAAFEKPPQVLTGKIWHPLGIVYMAGDSLAPGEPVAEDAVLLTDDWPFVYLQGPAVPLEYLIAIALILLASLGAVRGVAGRYWDGVDLRFFALGAGFLLLETRALTLLALHLGATWSVNAAVFAGVLVMALLSTVLAASVGRRASQATATVTAYAALGLLLAINVAVPTSAFEALPFVPRVLLAVTLASSPLLASGVLFALGITRSGSADRALASNLLGAMVGGLIEYSSMMLGLSALVPIAAVFYLGALLVDLRARGPQVVSPRAPVPDLG